MVADRVSVSRVVSVAGSAESEPLFSPGGAGSDGSAKESGGGGNFDGGYFALACVVCVVERANWERVVREVADSLERGGFNDMEVIWRWAELGDIRKSGS